MKITVISDVQIKPIDEIHVGECFMIKGLDDCYYLKTRPFDDVAAVRLEDGQVKTKSAFNDAELIVVDAELIIK